MEAALLCAVAHHGFIIIIIIAEYKPCLIKQKHDFDIFEQYDYEVLRCTISFTALLSAPHKSHVLHDDFQFYFLFFVSFVDFCALSFVTVGNKIQNLNAFVRCARTCVQCTRTFA